jgi:hypothetical protein
MKTRIYVVTQIHSGIGGYEKYSGDVANFPNSEREDAREPNTH